MALAHPLGNFTINTSASLVAAARTRSSSTTPSTWPRSPRSRSEGRSIADGDGALSSRGDRRRTAAPPARNCETGLHSGVDGTPARLVGALLRPLPARRAGRVPDAPAHAASSGRRSLPAADARPRRSRTRTIRDRLGWHEVTAAGDGATIVRADVPSESSEPAAHAPIRTNVAPSNVRSASVDVPSGRRGSSRAVHGRNGDAGERRAPRRLRLPARSLGGTHRAHDRGGDRASAPSTRSVPVTGSR